MSKVPTTRRSQKGRPKTPGSGSKKGSKLRRTKINEAKRELLRKRGRTADLSPLAHMLKVVNDKHVKTPLRLTAARDAAPYVHHRKPSIYVVRPVEDMTDDELKALAFGEGVKPDIIATRNVEESGDGDQS